MNRMSVSVTFSEERPAEQAAETAARLASEGVPEALAGGDPTL